jgi:N-acetylglucosaminyldiphosphoundecaprenol N-acetyl-beta-D-mannosaminyltransferase
MGGRACRHARAHGTGGVGVDRAALRERVPRPGRTRGPGSPQREARRLPDGANRCAAVLAEECPGLNVVGAISPPYGFDGDPGALADIRAEIVAARPDLILVGIGFPRQERVIAALRTQLPSSWFLGCGMAIGFVAGDQRRAPTWMRRGGVEWVHRLASEPGRLAERYLRHDLPFAVSLLTTTAIARVRPERGSPALPSGRDAEPARVEVRRARHRR